MKWQDGVNVLQRRHLCFLTYNSPGKPAFYSSCIFKSQQRNRGERGCGATSQTNDMSLSFASSVFKTCFCPKVPKGGFAGLLYCTKMFLISCCVFLQVTCWLAVMWSSTAPCHWLDRPWLRSCSTQREPGMPSGFCCTWWDTFTLLLLLTVSVSISVNTNPD